MSQSRVALVTGASRGLGAVIARRLGAAGWAVAVNYRSAAERAERVVGDIRADGGRAASYAADVTDEGAVADLVARIEGDLGPVLAVVANATGPQPNANLDELTWDAYLDQFRFFVKSPTLLAQAVLPAMKRHRFGRLVLIGSDMVDRALPGSSAYAAAKAAEAELVKVWARELGPHRITVNLVAPGWIPVERHVGADPSGYLGEVPLGRMGTPDDIAGLVAYLASDAAGFVTAQRVSVNGGHTIG
ncbi:MAG: SDR family oxidoreductase [Micropruina sp.]|uniref:SDR family NAD(P)-dependent oxidoreductase n=1 Tax=Micropruina sp. TaxID=2737536 RepID=UPI0039E5FBAB